MPLKYVIEYLGREDIPTVKDNVVINIKKFEAISQEEYYTFLEKMHEYGCLLVDKYIAPLEN